MSCELFAKTKFQARTIATIEQANAVLEEYAAQGFTLTLRQLFYQFVARGLIANTTAEYKRLSRTITDARRAGLSIGIILKTGRATLEAYPSWKSAADILRRAAESYQGDLWANQRRRPEIWIEKAALIGVIKPACRRWRVPHIAARGYPSHSEFYSAALLLESGLTPIVFYLGDPDPSALDMTRSLEEELSLYARLPIEVIRLGLNLDQVHELRLPPNPTKETDNRYEQYVRETGCTDSWELDALSPTFIDGLIERAISDLVDHEAWEEAFDREQANRDLLARTARRVQRAWGGR
jgi:hypothetical protein